MTAFTLRTLRLLALLAVGPALSAQTGGPGQEQPPPQPQAVLSAEAWNFGTLWYGDPASFDLTLSNAGAGTLEVRSIGSSCACVAAELEDRSLEPGESAVIRVRFDSRKRQGEVSTRVHMVTNDPDRYNIDFPVIGNVKNVVTIEPSTVVRLATLDPKAVDEATIRIRNNYTQPLKPRLLNPDSTIFEARLNQLEEGQLYELKVRNRTPIEQPVAHDEITVATGLDRQPEIKLNAVLNLQPRVVLSRKALYVPPAMKNESTQIVQLRFFADGDFNVTDISSSSGTVSVEFEPPQYPARPAGVLSPFLIQPLTIRLPAGDALPEGGVELQFRTNDPGVPLLTLRITNDMAVYREWVNPAQSPVTPTRIVPLPTTSRPAVEERNESAR